MPKVLAYLGQGVVYAGIALLLGYFSADPAYDHFPSDKAQLLLSFSHGGHRKGACRQLTREEIEAMAANMRRAEVCPRERLPVFVELLLDGERLYAASLPPSGLSGDGASQAYQRLVVKPGPYELTVRLRDSDRAEGFDYERTGEIELRPGQNFVIDFRSELGGFIFGAGQAAAPANGRGS